MAPKRSNWKVFERKIAKKFHGFRVIRMDYGVHDLDVVAEPFGIECKYAKEFSHEKALEQCEQVIADIEDRRHLIPLAVCAHPGTRGQETVAMRFKVLVYYAHGGYDGPGAMVHPDAADEIIVLPLQTFINILDRTGVQYGKKTG